MPTQTFQVAASGDDANVSKEGDSLYPPTTATNVTSTGNSIAAHRSNISGFYYVYNGLFKWDTSSLPDTATVTSAVFRGLVISLSNADSLSLTADWFTWNGTTGDYTATPQTSALSGVALSSLTNSSDNDLTLTNVSNVSKTGTTYLRFHISQRASDAAPTGQNTVQFVAFDHPSLGSSSSARLIVTYTTGGGDLLDWVNI